MRVLSFVFAVATSLLAWGLGGQARAASGVRLPVSNEAAITGGAVLAGGRDVGSFWYNPALLGRVHRAEVEANAEVYGVRWVRANRGAVFDGVSEERAVRPLRSTEVVSVPTMFASAFALSPNLTLGVGLYAPTATNLDAQATVQSSDDEDDSNTASVRYRRASQQYHLSLGLGWNVHDDFQVGLSLSPFYDEQRREQRVVVVQPPRGDDPGSSFLLDEEISTSTVGLSSKLGIRGRLGRLVHGAVALETPRFVLSQSTDRVQVDALLHADTASAGVDDANLESGRVSPLRGWSLATGLSVGQRDWRISADASASVGGPRPSWGVRVGGRALVTDRVTLGAGVFFDSNDNADQSLGAIQMARWGGSAGIEFRKRFELAGRDQGRTIELRTTLAAQYTYGRGTLGGVRIVGATDQAPAGFTVASTPAELHTVIVHIGSALAF